MGKKAILGLLLLVPLCILWFLFRSLYIMETSEMEPGIPKGTWMLVDRGAYDERPPRIGEVVMCHNYKMDAPAAKRVMAVGGTSIALFHGDVYINGHLLSEHYITGSVGVDFPDTPVPEGKIFVLNDRRNLNSDSRSFGLIRQEDIIGRVVLIY